MSKARELSKLPNYVLSTVAELKLAVGKEQGDKAFIGGYYADGDGGGGDFYWDAVSVEADNGGTIFQVTGTTTGRWKRIYSGSVSVKWFGAVGNGTTDDTVAIQNVIDNFKSVYIPTGTYYVDLISISNSNNISTDKFNTIIKQKPQSLTSKPCIIFASSDSSLDDIAVIGNISTDTGEWNAAVYINANSTYGALRNIKCGNIKGTDIRGDALYISGAIGYDVSSVTVGNVIGDNILRNCVSITGGNGIVIGDIYSNNVGLLNLDIECEPYNTPAKNITVGNIIGKGVWCVPSSATSYADNVYIKSVYLRPSLGGVNSTPAYTYGGARDSAIQLRNTKSIHFGLVDIADYNNAGIYYMFNSGELGCEKLHIDTLISSNCNVTDTTYKATINSLNLANQNIQIDKATMSISDAKYGFLYGNLKLGYVTATLGSSSIFSRYNQITIENGASITGGVLFGSSGGIVNNCIFNGVTFSNYNNAKAIELVNSTITATTIANPSNQNNHRAIASTVNTVFYADGKLLETWQSPMAYGAYRTWINAGKLYIKSGIPTSATDGTIVGTQT